MGKPTALPVWNELKAEKEKFDRLSLSDLFAADANRADKFSVKLGGLAFDYSRNHLTGNTLDLLSKLVERQNLPDWRARMFRGDIINVTENRAVLHAALRAQTDAPIMVNGKNVIPDIRAAQKQMARFAADVREKRWLGATGKPITHVVNIGIGGSDLGPRLAVKALCAFADGPEIRFAANVDPGDLAMTLKGLDPATTLFVVVSKTFTTQETIMNAQSARSWLTGALGDQAVAKHFVAISVNADAVKEFGIHPDNMFPMWDWVGGRYSLWSAVGLCVALSVGWDNFEKMLAGAASMDAHFVDAPLSQNMPVLMGAIGVWYRNFWGSCSRGILAYDERLRDLPRFLQQLEMESNGKSVTVEGEPVDYPTSPVVFGECGSVGQHSFHQWLHQGTDIIPVDFICAKQDDWNNPGQHKALVANLYAQSEALMCGSMDEKSPHRVNPGNRPSSHIWLERLDPYNFGALLALYEHKTFVQGVIWGINSFDQFGVELGKKLASRA